MSLKAVNRASRHQTTSNKTDLQQQKLNRTAQHRRKTEFFRKLYSRWVTSERFPLRSIQFLLPFLVLSAAVPVAFAQHGRLLVAQKGDTSLAIVDPIAGAVITSVDEGGITGHEVAGSPDGKLAIVPIYGNSGVGAPGTTAAWALEAPRLPCGRRARA